MGAVVLQALEAMWSATGNAIGGVVTDGAPLEMLLAARFSKSSAAGRLLMDIRGQITATFRSFVFYRRKYSAHFTAAFPIFAFYRRNSAAHFTVAFRALHCPPNGRV